MSVDKRLQAELIATAHRLADAARPKTLAHFRTSALVAEDKSGVEFDPVTVADRAAEQAMRDVLSRERPEDAILGEEYGKQSGTTGLIWVLDPIDGTRGYISGTPTWGVLISIADDTGPLFGLIDQPYIGERFVGGFGVSEFDGPLGKRPLGCRTGRSLADATVLTTFPEVGSDAEGRAFHRVASQSKLTRYGMDCYGYALLASGQVDLVIEAGLQPYDIQAPIAVVEAAGGLLTDWEGNPAHNGGRSLAAATPALHAEALALLQKSLHG